jgi:flagellin-like hook-associated protein FlgL
MSNISPVNNVTNIIAENSLSNTQSQLQTTLQQLSTGNELVSPAIAPANSSIAAGLNANIAALTQSAQNTQNGVGELQTAAGALSQVTTLLNTAITLATQGATSGLSTQQSAALDTEFQSILGEIGTIGSTTNFNGTAVFGTTLSVFTSDGTSNGSNSVSTSISALSTTALSLTGLDHVGHQPCLGEQRRDRLFDQRPERELERCLDRADQPAGRGQQHPEHQHPVGRFAAHAGTDPAADRLLRSAELAAVRAAGREAVPINR